jgi:uncharacterized protein (DUF2062 family)
MRRLLDYLTPSMHGASTWLERHPRIADSLHRTGCLRFDHRTVSRGVGIGLFIALTPTVGFQILMMLGACLVLRGNFPVAFLASWISNPLTMAPLYFGYHALGELIFSPFVDAALSLAGYGENPAVDVSYVALGSLLVAMPVAFIGYIVFAWVLRSWLVHRRRRHRQQRRMAARAAAASDRQESDDSSPGSSQEGDER